MENQLKKVEYYKDRTPEQTIFLLRKKLEESGIFVMETVWLDNFNQLYSCRLEIKDTKIGANGKGLTIPYALASAYGELFERMLTHMLFMNLDLGDTQEKYGFYLSPKEVLVSPQSFEPLPPAFKKSYMFSDNYSTYEYWNDTYIHGNNLGEIRYIPFYELRSRKNIFLPSNIIYMMSGSNGMCAGNTPHEALAQGFSEIFERYVMKMVYWGKQKVTQIMRHHLVQYFPKENALIKKIEENSSFKITVLDCTNQGYYPVIAILVNNIDTHQYSVCFGADPDLRIALHRCITEVFQGSQTLEEKSNPLELVSPENIMSTDYNNQLKNSSGRWSYEFFHFSGESAPLPTSFNSAKEKFDYLVNLFVKNNVSDIYIRDCSLDDFYIYQIIIPGFSEAFIHDDMRKTFLPLKLTLDYFFERHTPRETEQICRELLVSNKFEYGNKLFWISFANLQINENSFPLSWEYLMFSLFFQIGKTEEANRWLKEYINTISTNVSSNSLLVLSNYLSLCTNGINNKDALDSIEDIYGFDSVIIVKRIIDNPLAIINVDLENLNKAEQAYRTVYAQIKYMQIQHGGMTI